MADAGLAPVIAKDLKVGMTLYITRKVKPDSELGQLILNRIKIDREELERFQGRSLIWRVTSVIPFTWGKDLPGYDPREAYRIEFVTTSPAAIHRVEEFFPENEVGFTCM